MAVLIIAGAKKVRKQLGAAADFCPICREYRAFLVTEVRQVPHLYYIPVGAGKTLAAEVECSRCHSIFEGTAGGYAGYSRAFIRDLPELARLTNPDIVSRTRPRIEAEDRVRSGHLSDDERGALILEPFVALDYMVRRKWGRGTLSGAAVAALAAVAGLLVAAIIVGASGHGRDVALVLGAMVVPATAAAAVALFNGPGAWVRRHIQPRLVAALLPLNPSAEEIAAALEQARLGSVSLARRVDAIGLRAALERAARDHAAPPPDMPIASRRPHRTPGAA